MRKYTWKIDIDSMEKIDIWKNCMCSRTKGKIINYYIMGPGEIGEGGGGGGGGGGGWKFRKIFLALTFCQKKF